MTNVNGLKTNFNTSPYYDDYDENKNFYRILTKAGRFPIQSRELNQTQAILQNQIKKFAEHVFIEGTIVSGGEFHFLKNLYYVKINDLNANGNTVNVSDFSGQNLTGLTTQVTAIVHSVSDGLQSTSDPKTIFVYFISAGSDNVTHTFQAGEEVVADNGLKFTVSSTDPIGLTSGFTISSGVVFAKGHFINFEEQSIIMEKYSTTPSVLVGFDIVESIITFNEDYTLLDPAQGFNNYAAPGADRLKLTAELVQYSLSETNLDNFMELFKLESGILQEKYDKTQYSQIRDELARRTYDESGDYYVSGLNVLIREHLDTGSNGGYLSSTNGGDSTKLAYGITAGKAYIKGYDVEKLVTSYLVANKGTDYLETQNQPVTVNYGNYVYCNELVGAWDQNTGSVVTLYDTAQGRLTNKLWSTATQTGTILGNAKIKSVEWVSGVKGTPSASYRVYLYDIKLTGGKFQNVRSIYLDNTSKADACADVILTSGQAILNESNYRFGVYPITNKSIKTVRNASNNVDVSVTVLKSYDINIPTTGNFTVNTGSTNLSFENSIGTLNSTQKSKMNLSVNSQVTLNLAGTVTVTSGNPTVIGSGTQFNKLNVGDKLTITGVTGVYYIQAITNNTSLTLTSNVADSATGATLQKNYFPGDLIDLNTIGYTTGNLRDVTIVSNTSMSVSLGETFTTSVTGTLNVNLVRTSAKEGSKIRKSNRYVQISCATAGVNGPFNLGFSDVIKINSVRKNSSAFTSSTQGTDITSHFKLDNGQKDDIYDLAKLIKRSGSLSASDYLLICLDYYQPSYTQGWGYFSVDSYPVDDSVTSDTTIKTEEIPIYVSPSNNKSYDLRNCIDIRPVKVNTANDSTTVGGASTNPPTTESLVSIVDGLMSPAPDTNFDVTYQYYLGRKDLVVLDQLGMFKIVKGIPSLNPVSPSVPTDSMALATVEIAPYPSLSSDYAAKIGRLDLSNNVKKTSFKRYTMRDVGVLDNRLSNLEYYTALTLLEKRTLDLKISDDNGLERYKNGIFVDAFNNHLSGDLNNPDFTICVDGVNGEIRPMFKNDISAMTFGTGSNVSLKNNLLTLAYTDSLFIGQPYATNVRNASNLYWSFKGKMQLNPSSDFWNDVQTLPSIQVTDDASAIALQSLATSLGVTWNSWQATSTGVTTTTSDGNSTTTTTTTTTNNTRTGTQYVVDTTTNTQSLGNRVVSTSLIPYMRSIPIKVFVNGLKPNTKMYAFFDGEDVTQYVVQTDSTYTVSSTDGVVNSGTIISDSTGSVYALFLLPCNENKKFTVGTKILRLTDAIDNGSGAITYAETSFTSQGLNEQVQSTYLTTAFATLNKETVSETSTSTSSTSTTSWDVQNVGSFRLFPCCFLAGTPVLLQDGTYKNIEDMSIGDSVVGNTGINKVVGVTTTELGARKILKVGEKVYTTNDHLFMTDNGWKTWTPQYLIDNMTATSRHLEGANKFTPISDDDEFKVFEKDTGTFNYRKVGDVGIVECDYPKDTVVYEVMTTGDHTYIVDDYIVHNKGDPIAQTFNTGTNSTYVYVTGVDLFFQTKDSEVGVTVELKEVNSDGYISDKTIPYTITYVPSSSINVSDNGSVSTRVNFSGPICLSGNTTYGLVITPQNSNPNFRMWTSKLGEIDKITNSRVSSQPFTGNLFLSSDSITWSPVQDEDLKFNLYRAVFNTSGGTAYINNANLDILNVTNTTGSWRKYSEPVVGEYTITLSGTPSISVGYIATVSGIEGTVNYVSGNTIRVSTPYGRELLIGAVTIKNLSGTVVYTGTATSISRPSGTLERFEAGETTSLIKISNVSGVFNVGEKITGRYSGDTAVIDSFGTIPYSLIDYESSFLEVTGTSIDWSMRTATGNTLDSTYETFVINDNNYLNVEKNILSHSIETSTLGGNSISTKVSLYTISDYLSPVIDLNRTYAILVRNIINNDDTGEDSISGGNAINRYISQKVELKDGQDAEDMKIILSCYRPSDSNIEVYAKLINGDDSETFEDKKWIKMEMETNSLLYSNSSNKSDLKEFTWNIPRSMMTGPSGEFQYVNNSGVTLTTYKQFQIKIILLGTNSANVPRCADLSVIALQL